MTARKLFLLIAICLPPLPALADSGVEGLLEKPASWFVTDEGRRTLENVLSWQTQHGDWPKNMDTTRQKFSGNGEQPAGTFDNGATCGELRVLARAFRASGDERYEQAFLRGFDHILEAQYASGGWPQFYPLSSGYHRHITFNDGTMIRLMEFLRDATSAEDFAFLDQDRREAAKAAVDRGIQCIVQCQVLVDGKPTVWCAQHDAQTLAPVQARSYELPSLSGAESAGILRFLMSLDTPTPDVVSAIHAGVAWFDSVQIQGYRYRKSENEPSLTPDPRATPLWARFYEIESNRPIFSDRDGVVKYDIDEIGKERRDGYAWYGTWGVKVLEDYARWPHR